MFELINKSFKGNFMSPENNNLNQYLEGKIKNSLNIETSEMFTDELMKRIHLNLEFAKEDKKFSRFANFLMTGLGAAMFLFIALLGVYILEKPDDYSVQISSVFSSVYDFLYQISSRILSSLGLTVMGDNLLYIAIISVIILILLITDKYILQKRINN